MPFSSLEVSEVCLEVYFSEFGGVRGARSRVWRCFRCAESGPNNTIKSLRTPARRPRLGKDRILVSYFSQLGTKKKEKDRKEAPQKSKALPAPV